MRDLTFLCFGLQKTKRERWRANEEEDEDNDCPRDSGCFIPAECPDSWELSHVSLLISFHVKATDSDSFNVFSFVTVCAHLSFRCTCVCIYTFFCSALCWCNLFLLMQMLFELSWQLTCVWGIFTAFTNVYDDWTVYNNIIKQYYLFRSFLLLPHLLCLNRYTLLLLLKFILLTFHLFFKITMWWVFGGMSFQMTSHVQWLIRRV